MEELGQAINELNTIIKQETDPILDKLCRVIQDWYEEKDCANCMAATNFVYQVDRACAAEKELKELQAKAAILAEENIILRGHIALQSSVIDSLKRVLNESKT